LQDAGRKRRRCIVAAGVAVAVVLCMSWAHASRMRPGFAGLDNHMIGTAARLGTAGTDSGQCTAGSALASVRLPGRDPLWRGPGDLRQQRVQVVLAADVRPGQSITDSPDSGQAPAGTAGMRTTGRPATVAITDVGCRFARRWFAAGQYFTPFRLPFGIGRHRIQVLAFGGWSAEGPPGQSRAAVRPMRMRNWCSDWTRQSWIRGTAGLFLVRVLIRAPAPTRRAIRCRRLQAGIPR
jgi:hypothetical protein